MTVAVAMPDDGDGERPIDETLWERRMQAVSLRNAGMTWSQIAAIQHISPAMVRRDVDQALRELASGQIDQIIARHRSVLLDIQRANYPAMLDGGDRKAQVAATKAIIDALAHEAKLLGLYAPTRVVTGVNEVEFSERFVELVNAVSPDTLKELLRGTHVRPPTDREPEPGEPVDAEVIDLQPAVADAPDQPPGEDGQPSGADQPGADDDAAPARDDDADDGDAPPADDWSNIGG